MKNDIEEYFDTPIMVIGYRGFPINGFCSRIVYKGEICDRYNFSRHETPHSCYKSALMDFKKELSKSSVFNHLLTDNMLTLQDFVNNKHFKNPVKNMLYKFYLKIGKLF